MSAAAEASLVAYSNELAAIQAQLTALKQAETAVKTHIADLIAGQVGDIIAEGRPVFTISYAKRFDADLAATVLAGLNSPGLLEACTTTVIDSAKAKAVLAPAIYEMCQATSDKPTIKPRVAP